MGKEAVKHPGRSAADAPVPLLRQQEGKQAMRGMIGVPRDDDGSSSVDAAAYRSPSGNEPLLFVGPPAPKREVNCTLLTMVPH